MCIFFDGIDLHKVGVEIGKISVVFNACSNVLY